MICEVLLQWSFDANKEMLYEFDDVVGKLAKVTLGFWGYNYLHPTTPPVRPVLRAPSSPMSHKSSCRLWLPHDVISVPYFGSCASKASYTSSWS